tara:strand:- start:1221 stop:3464 length:2244 start_codon:yes stop_codon:yes gene_type:complete
MRRGGPCQFLYFVGLVLLLLAPVSATDITFLSPQEGLSYNLGEEINLEGYIISTDTGTSTITLSVDGTALSSKEVNLYVGQIISFSDVFDNNSTALSTIGDNIISVAVRKGELSLAEESVRVSASNELSISVAPFDKVYVGGDTVTIQGVISGIRILPSTTVLLTAGEETVSYDSIDGRLLINFTTSIDLEEIFLEVSDAFGNYGNLTLPLSVSNNLVVEPNVEPLDSGYRSVFVSAKVYDSKGDIIVPEELTVAVTGPHDFSVNLLKKDRITFREPGVYNLSFSANLGEQSGAFVKELEVSEGLSSAGITVFKQLDGANVVDYEVNLVDNFGRSIENSEFYLIFLGPENKLFIEKHETDGQGHFEGELNAPEWPAGQWDVAVAKEIPEDLDEDSTLNSLQFLDAVSRREFNVLPNLKFEVDIDSRTISEDSVTVSGFVRNVGNVRGDDITVVIDCPQCEKTSNLMTVSLAYGESTSFESTYPLKEGVSEIGLTKNLKLIIPDLKSTFFRELFAVFLVSAFFVLMGSRRVNYDMLLRKIPFSHVSRIKYSKASRNISNIYTGLMKDPNSKSILTLIFSALIIAVSFDITNASISFFNELFFLGLILIATYFGVQRYVVSKYSVIGSFEFWLRGGLVMLASAVIFNVPFGAPYKSSRNSRGVSLFVSPVLGLALSLVSLLVYYQTQSAWSMTFAAMNSTFALFHLIPIKPLNGYPLIKKYSSIWFMLFITVLFIYIWIKFLLPFLVFV